jgi:hypothetical protein
VEICLKVESKRATDFLLGWCFVTCDVVGIFKAGMFAINSDRNYRKRVIYTAG